MFLLTGNMYFSIAFLRWEEYNVANREKGVFVLKFDSIKIILIGIAVLLFNM